MNQARFLGKLGMTFFSVDYGYLCIALRGDVKMKRAGQLVRSFHFQHLLIFGAKLWQWREGSRVNHATVGERPFPLPAVAAPHEVQVSGWRLVPG